MIVGDNVMLHETLEEHEEMQENDALPWTLNVACMEQKQQLKKFFILQRTLS